MLKILVNAGCKINWKDHNSLCLYLAARNEYKLLWALIQRGLDVNRKIYEENRREVFWEELAWLRSGKMFMRYEMEQDQEFGDYAFDRKEKIWFRGCFAPAWKSYLVKLENSRKMNSFRKLTEINDLLAFSEDGKRCAYVIPGKTSKVYIYSLEKETCEKEITLKDSELSWFEIQFVGNRYIAVRGCDYMFWYEI